MTSFHWWEPSHWGLRAPLSHGCSWWKSLHIALLCMWSGWAPRRVGKHQKPFEMVPDDVVTMGHHHLGSKMGDCAPKTTIQWEFLEGSYEPLRNPWQCHKAPQHHRCNQYCGNDWVNSWFEILVKITFFYSGLTTKFNLIWPKNRKFSKFNCLKNKLI